MQSGMHDDVTTKSMFLRNYDDHFDSNFQLGLQLKCGVNIELINNLTGTGRMSLMSASHNNNNSNNQGFIQDFWLGGGNLLVHQ